VTKDPDPPSQAAQGRTVPLELERVAMRAIRKEPDQRYQDMGEMVSELLEARAALLGDRPLDSQLRVSRIMPPSSEQATSMAVPARDVARLQGEPAPGNPTATAGELVGPVTPPRRRTGLVVGAMSAALLTGAGAVVAYHVYQGSSAGPDQPPVVAAKTPTVPDAARLPDAPRPEPRMVSVVVSSVPTGAAILRDGKRVGKTPEVLSVRTGEKMTLVLRREGYRDHAVTIETKPGQQKLVKEIRLASTRRRRRRHRPRRREPERSVIPHRTKPQPVSDHGDHGDHGPDTTVNRGTGDSSHVDGH
jgi:hypothetical protein